MGIALVRGREAVDVADVGVAVVDLFSFENLEESQAVSS